MKLSMRVRVLFFLTTFLAGLMCGFSVYADEYSGLYRNEEVIPIQSDAIYDENYAAPKVEQSDQNGEVVLSEATFPE